MKVCRILFIYFILHHFTFAELGECIRRFGLIGSLDILFFGVSVFLRTKRGSVEQAVYGHSG